MEHVHLALTRITVVTASPYNLFLQVGEVWSEMLLKLGLLKFIKINLRVRVAMGALKGFMDY